MISGRINCLKSSLLSPKNSSYTSYIDHDYMLDNVGWLYYKVLPYKRHTYNMTNEERNECLSVQEWLDGWND